MSAPSARPVVALTLGDPAGIGPELIARLLALPSTHAQANVVLLGDPWLWERGQQVAGVSVPTDALTSLAEVRSRRHSGRAAFVAMDTVQPEDVTVGQVSAAGGAACCRSSIVRWMRRWRARSMPSVSRR